MTVLSTVLKIATAIFVLGLFWQCIEVWIAGRRLAHCQTPLNKELLMTQHKRRVLLLVLLTLLALAPIELMVQLSPNKGRAEPLFVTHLCIDALLVPLCLALVTYVTGKRQPRWHKPLVYVFFTVYALAATTGLVLLYKL